ncbi:MAG: hypothetical protein AABZ54_00405 [Bacteroidota bacterium]
MIGYRHSAAEDLWITIGSDRSNILLYDFSKGVRGKFYSSNARLNLPIYLDEDIAEFINKYAKRKKFDNQLIFFLPIISFNLAETISTKGGCIE